jgi:hypothetical protein
VAESVRFSVSRDQASNTHMYIYVYIYFFSLGGIFRNSWQQCNSALYSHVSAAHSGFPCHTVSILLKLYDFGSGFVNSDRKSTRHRGDHITHNPSPCFRSVRSCFVISLHFVTFSRRCSLLHTLPRIRVGSHWLLKRRVLIWIQSDTVILVIVPGRAVCSFCAGPNYALAI